MLVSQDKPGIWRDWVVFLRIPFDRPAMRTAKTSSASFKMNPRHQKEQNE
jgi:hypothetical protein